jgi:hypothetical protein
MSMTTSVHAEALKMYGMQGIVRLCELCCCHPSSKTNARLTPQSDPVTVFWILIYTKP